MKPGTRQSVAAVALITRELEGRRQWLAQWNPKWQRYNFVSGHRREGESFRECMVREVREELGLRDGVDFAVGVTPLAHLEFDDWSESAREQTHYTMEVFAVGITTDAARQKVTADSRNCWLNEEEIQMGRSSDGKPVSATMERLLEELRNQTHAP
jgi:8-oxo-dGTP pyrophosphatase MutT (NUDIX family)